MIDTALLEGEAMNIGQFLAGLPYALPEPGGADDDDDDVFLDSINTKVNEWKRKVIGNEDEVQYREKCKRHKLNWTFVTFGLVKYLQDKWGFKLDFARYYTGAVPKYAIELMVKDNSYSVGSTNKFFNGCCPDNLDIWLGLLRGEALPFVASGDLSGKRPSEVFVDRVSDKLGIRNIWQDTCLFNRDVYVELDKGDISDEAIIVRALTDNFDGRWERLPVPRWKGEMDVVDTINNYKADIYRIRGCSANFILAPKESFSTGDTVQERLIKGNDLMREYASGEWHMVRWEENRKRNNRKHKCADAADVATVGVVKNKPAKDPVLLKMVQGGFLVMAAWNHEADDIYNIGDTLRLI